MIANSSQSQATHHHREGGVDGVEQATGRLVGGDDKNEENEKNCIGCREFKIFLLCSHNLTLQMPVFTQANFWFQALHKWASSMGR